MISIQKKRKNCKAISIDSGTKKNTKTISGIETNLLVEQNSHWT